MPSIEMARKRRRKKAEGSGIGGPEGLDANGAGSNRQPTVSRERTLSPLETLTIQRPLGLMRIGPVESKVNR